MILASSTRSSPTLTTCRLRAQAPSHLPLELLVEFHIIEYKNVSSMLLYIQSTASDGSSCLLAVVNGPVREAARAIESERTLQRFLGHAGFDERVRGPSNHLFTSRVKGNPNQAWERLYLPWK